MAIETIQLKDLDNVSNVTHVVGIGTDKAAGVFEKKSLAKDILSTASIYYSAPKLWTNPGWRRILIGNIGGILNAGIISIVQNFNESNGGGVIFAFLGSGYITPNINVLCKAGNGFSKIRVLTKTSTNATSLLIDVYYTKTNSNGIVCSLGNTITGAALTDLSDTIADIPEGFTATEFEI